MIVISPETPATPEPYLGPERRAEPAMTKDERFAKVYERFEDGTQRMVNIEASMTRIETATAASADRIDDRLDKQDALMQQNTTVTQEVKDILDTAKGAFRVFGWFGNAVKWGLGLGAAALGFWAALKDFRTH